MLRLSQGLAWVILGLSLGYCWVILGLRAAIFADCPVLLIPQALPVLRIAPCLRVNAPRIAFTRLPYPCPSEQIKTPYRANFCVILAHTHGLNAIASCI